VKPKINRRSIVSVGVVVSLACGFVGLAVASEGMPVAQVDMNDSGVWVTNGAMQHIGRFNYDAGQIDGVSHVMDVAAFDVQQDQGSVFVEGTVAGELVQVNPSTLAMGVPQNLGASAQVSQGNSMVGILLPDQGNFWMMPESAVPGFSPDSEAYPPAVDGLSSNAVAIVGTDGVAYVIDPGTRSMKTVRGLATSEDQRHTVDKTSFSGLLPDAHYSMTIVGRTPVVVNHDNNMIHLGSSKMVTALEVDEETGPIVLQAVSEGGTNVAYATSSALVIQPLSGGKATIHEASGAPAQPVHVGGCTYGVWSGSGEFIRDCLGEDNDSFVTIPDLDASVKLRFRVNWGNIVLNDVESGGIWLVSGDIQKVDNWDKALENDQGDDEEESSEEIDRNEKIDRSGINHPPVAYDDEFGARPGHSVLLPVVENDIDEDGDLLTVKILGGLPAGYEANLVYSESVIQLSVPESASGVISFPYAVYDGRGGQDKATVKVRISKDNENSAPVSVRKTALTVSAGKSVTHNVLTNWRDPDGDTIFLVDAESPKEDLVTITQDGTLTFQDGGKTTGVKTVSITVSDGSKSTTEDITVTVLPAGHRPPVPVPDLVSGTVGIPIEIHPLDNDTDPNGSTLRLTGVEMETDSTKCVLVKELSEGLITATCSEPGSYYLTYTVTNGLSANTESWIRILVNSVATGDEAPIAVPDTVLLTPGQDAYVFPLDNDINPLGHPLVITKVDADENLPVSVSVIDCEVVKITQKQIRAEEEAASPITISYTVSNGKKEASSKITIVPLPALDKILPPTAVDDTVTVRAGDIATVNVLANDTQPNGIALRLLPDLFETPDPDKEALVFTMGNTVRIHARNPGTYTVLYQVEVVKGTAEPDTGRLTIHVTPTDDGNTNQPPKPRDVEVRTKVGSPISINIPLEGIDPDGDQVSLVGLASPPSYGIITSMSADSFGYFPGDNTTGGDEFTYLVRDRLGAEAIGRVRIGIAPAAEMNMPPIAVTDYAESLPGGRVTVPVTLNDFDPDGDLCCYLTQNSVESEFFTGTTEGQNVVITAPQEPGSYWGTYRITDEFYNESTGVIILTVDIDILPKKPVVVDDFVSLQEALSNSSAIVDVLANDYDLDGDITRATVRVDDPRVVVSNNMVTVPITNELQIFDYSVTDTDKMVGHGFITVPGRSQIPPQFDFSAQELEVLAGQTVTFSLADYVLVRPGRQPRVFVADGVSAWNGTATAPSQTQLSFIAPENYNGRAAIFTEVSDGSTLEDDSGLSAVVTIPVKVVDESANRPAMRDTLLEVEVKESATLDLALMVSNVDDPGELAYSIIEQPSISGVDVSLSGTVLSASAEANVPAGSETVMRVSVKVDAIEVESKVTIKVVATKRPLPQAVDDVIPNANEGQTVCVPVTANDVNPFPDTPLKVVSARVETKSGGRVEAGCDGGQGVSITPPSNFFGSMVVAYVIEDATGDPKRQATGRVYLTVRGRPAPPAGLHIDKVGDSHVELSWQPPDNRGSRITHYTVHSSPGAAGYPKLCQTTTCTLTGLTNNTTYTFTVTATNEVGDSDHSMISDQARPDTFPNRLDAPTLAFGDRSLTVSWTPKGVPNKASPVTSYDLEISPTPTSGVSRVQGATGTSYQWEGLTNGTAYQVIVCARNRAEGVCDVIEHWSPWSQSMAPAAAPDPPAQPEVFRLDPVGSEGQVKVCWNQPNDNGDSIAHYTVRSSSGATYTVTPQGATTCQSTTLPTSETGYTFSVAATNKAGQGAFSPASPEFRSVVKPGPVSNLTSADQDGGCRLTFSPASLNGAKTSELKYMWSATRPSENKTYTGDFGSNTSGTATLPNSPEAYTIDVWARTTVQGNSQDSEKVSTGAVCRPFGNPKVPAVTAVNSLQGITLNWPNPSASQNGRTINYLEVRIDGGAATQKTSSGNQKFGTDCTQSHTIQARAIDSEGRASNWSSAVAAGGCSCSFAVTAPRVVDISWTNLPPNSKLLWTVNTTGCIMIQGTQTCQTYEGSGRDPNVGGWQVNVNQNNISFQVEGGPQCTKR